MSEYFIYYLDGENIVQPPLKVGRLQYWKILTPLSVSLIVKKTIKTQIKIFTSYTKDNELIPLIKLKLF